MKNRIALNENKIIDRLSRIFTIFIVVYPVLNRYKTPLPYFSLSEVILLTFWLIRLFQVNKEIKAAFTLIPFFVYVVFREMVLITGIENVDIQVIGTTSRLLFLYMSSFFLIPSYFDKEYGYKCLMIVGYLIGIYGLLQLIFSQFGVVLTQNIPFLVTNDDGEVQKTIERNVFIYGFRYRSTSLLTEPAHLCTYLLLPLSIMLSEETITKKNMLSALFFSVCCITSLSSTGIICVFFLWFFYLIKNYRTYINPKIFVPIFFLLSLIMLFFLKSNIWSYFINRTFDGDISNGLSKSSRFSEIEEMLSGSDNILTVLFGIGMKHNDHYLPGFARLYLCWGIFGVAFFIIFAVTSYFNCNQKSKYVLITYLLLNIGTEILLGNFAVYYMAFFLCTEDENELQNIPEKTYLGDIDYSQENIE